MKTLIITKKEVAQVLTPAVANTTVEKAFRAYGMGQTEMPAKSYITFPKGDLRSMPAYIHGQGFDIAGIKSVNVHTENSRKYGLPTVMAVIILTDPETGFPLAIMDGTYLTSMRTGAAGATAVKRNGGGVCGLRRTGADPTCVYHGSQETENHQDMDGAG